MNVITYDRYPVNGRCGTREMFSTVVPEMTQLKHCHGDENAVG